MVGSIRPRCFECSRVPINKIEEGGSDPVSTASYFFYFDKHFFGLKKIMIMKSSYYITAVASAPPNPFNLQPQYFRLPTIRHFRKSQNDSSTFNRGSEMNKF